MRESDFLIQSRKNSNETVVTMTYMFHLNYVDLDINSAKDNLHCLRFSLIKSRQVRQDICVISGTRFHPSASTNSLENECI